MLPVALILAAGIMMGCPACWGDEDDFPDLPEIEEDADASQDGDVIEPSPDEPDETEISTDEEQDEEVATETENIAIWPIALVLGGLAVGTVGYKVITDRTREKNLTRQQKRAQENKQKKNKNQSSNSAKKANSNQNNNSKKKPKKKSK